MTGLDTNIIVRFLTKDDEEQFQQAYQLLTQDGNSFMISYPVLLELLWVLETQYEYSRDKLIFLLKELIETKNFYFPDRSIVENSIQNYKNSKADFADCLIGTLNENNDCNTTYTFDKEASELSTFTLLE